VAALVAVGLTLFVLSSGSGRTDVSQTVATVGSCAVPDATQLLRDEPCTATPFRP
jgi:hypothetical protein